MWQVLRCGKRKVCAAFARPKRLYSSQTFSTVRKKCRKKPSIKTSLKSDRIYSSILACECLEKASIRTWKAIGVNVGTKNSTHRQWLWSHLGFFYYSKVEFTTVNTFSNVTGFSHFTMVNTDLVCCGGNGGRMKAKFTILNFPKTIWFYIAGISKLCLFRWHLVALFEMRSLSVTLLNLYMYF